VKLLLIALIAASSVLGTGCAETSPETPPVFGMGASEPMQGFPRDPGMLFGGSSAPTTGRVLSRADVLASDPRAVLGDTAYAEVNSKWLPRFYDCFRAELFGNGISKWDARFTCRHFATYYAALAQARFYLETFHNFEKANALALGTFWYVHPDGSGHAIIIALTERGRVFIEPQTGREVRLTPAEQRSGFLEVF